MKNLFKGSLTVPNLISVIRILLIPVFAYLFYKGEYTWAVLVLALSGISDFLDGTIARKFNQISDLGKVLDPVADKLTQITIAVMLFREFRKPESGHAMNIFAWVFLFFLIKELIMILGGLLMLLMGLRPGAAEIYGKVATLLFYVVMAVIMAFGPNFGAFTNLGVKPMPDSLIMVLVVIAALSTLVALLSYVPGFFKELKEKKTKEIAKEDK